MPGSSTYHPGPGRAISIQSILDALQHEHRRQILKVGVELGEPVSATMASRIMGVPLKITSNHFQFLHRKGLLMFVERVPRRGVKESFYIPHPDVFSHPVVSAVLDVT